MCIRDRYPIMLIHGIGYKDEDYEHYWGRIPEFLKKHGAKIYFGNQDAFGNIEHNAAQIKISAEKALAETGADKLNPVSYTHLDVYKRQPLGYHPCNVGILTTRRDPALGQCLAGSLTGAVAS